MMIFPSHSSMLLWALIVFHCLSTSLACISDIQDIYDAERSISNTNTQRTYILCPNKLYEIGYLDFNHNVRKNQAGGPPLPLRSNMKIQCGDDGKRENLCWLTDGDIQVDGTAIRGLNDERLDNVEIVGLVFMNSIKHSLWVTKPGSITFKDCEWKDHTRSRGPVMLDYFDSYSSDELVVTLEDCHFHDNKYFGYGAQTALVIGNSEQSRIVLRRTVFNDNDMRFNNTSPTSYTHVLESLGPTQIDDSCFVNNLVSAAGVAVYGNEFQSSGIHVSNTGGSLCPFAGVYQNLDQYRNHNPACVQGDTSVSTCVHLATDVPLDDSGPVKHFVPFTANALDYDSAFEIGDSVFEGGCNRKAGLTADGPDAQNTEDNICLQFGGCHVSHTMAGEHLVYKFAHDNRYAVDGTVLVDVVVRVASPSVDKQFRLEVMYGGQVEYSSTFASPGQGYKEYSTITWNNVPLMASEATHSVRLWFVNGNINFCAIGVRYVSEPGPGPNPGPTTPNPTVSTITQPPTTSPVTDAPPSAGPSQSPIDNPMQSPVQDPDGGPGANYDVPPVVWRSLDYYKAIELTPDDSRGGCNWRNDGVDAQPTTDEICRTRDKTSCNIAWWDANESLHYLFSIPASSIGSYDIRVRAASPRAGRHLGMELIKADGSPWESFASFDVPSNGWQNFDDMFWSAVDLEAGDYILIISSKSGGLNLCSVAVLPAEDSEGPDPDEDYQIMVPGFYNAMSYIDPTNDSTSDNIGNCPFRKGSPVDAKLVNDATCQQATTEFSQHCNIAFTESNESVFYDIQKKPGQSTLKISFRMASYSPKDVRIELFSAGDMTLLASTDIRTPGRQDWNAYDTLPVWDSVNVGSGEFLKMKVTFLNGGVNFCAFEVE